MRLIGTFLTIKRCVHVRRDTPDIIIPKPSYGTFDEDGDLSGWTDEPTETVVFKTNMSTSGPGGHLSPNFGTNVPGAIGTTKRREDKLHTLGGIY